MSSIKTPEIDIRDYRSARNYIINGGLDYWQRASSKSFSKTGSDGTVLGYTADRFMSYVTRGGEDMSFTVSKQTDVPNTSFTSSIRITSDLNHNLGSNNSFIIPLWQYIEGSMSLDIQPSSDIYISYWVKSNVAISNLASSIQTWDSSGTYNASGMKSYVWHNSLEANTWKRVTKKLTIPNVTLHRGNGICFRFMIGHITNSSANSTYDQWIDYDNWGSAASSNWAASSGNYLQITGVQISTTEHSEFTRAGLNMTNELLLCQRYFAKSYAINVFAGSTAENGIEQRSSSAVGAANVFWNIALPVTLRTAPTLTVYSPSTGTAGKLYDVDAATDVDAAAYSVGDYNGGYHLINITNNASFGGTYRRCRVHFTADAEIP